jgi:hypothetical protein
VPPVTHSHLISKPIKYKHLAEIERPNHENPALEGRTFVNIAIPELQCFPMPYPINNKRHTAPSNRRSPDLRDFLTLFGNGLPWGFSGNHYWRYP